MRLLLTLMAALAVFFMVQPASAASLPQPGLESGSVYDDGMPPEKYQGGAIIPILAYSGSLKDDAQRQDLCDAEVPSGMTLLGCVLPNGATVLPNPCSADFAGEQFALIACHELGHSNGWPGNHPREAISSPSPVQKGLTE